jgi:hypothetical protein
LQSLVKHPRIHSSQPPRPYSSSYQLNKDQMKEEEGEEEEVLLALSLND